MKHGSSSSANKTPRLPSAVSPAGTVPHSPRQRQGKGAAPTTSSSCVHRPTEAGTCTKSLSRTRLWEPSGDGYDATAPAAPSSRGVSAVTYRGPGATRPAPAAASMVTFCFNWGQHKEGGQGTSPCTRMQRSLRGTNQ